MSCASAVWSQPASAAPGPGAAPVSNSGPVQPGRPLPRHGGTVPVDSTVAVAAEAGATSTAAAASNRTAVRALVVALDAGDWGAATWRAMLDRTGAGYDVLYSRSTDLTASSLVRPDGTGRYNAILLTNNSLLHPDGTGAFVSAFSADEWNLLWGYERDFGVRQATLYASYGSFPEDYCLRAGTEGGVGDTPLNVGLTATGARVFNYLKATAQIPVIQSYVYRDQLDTACGGEAVLTAGGNVLGVMTTSADGRERLALTFTSNQYLLQAHLLTYGLFRWASRGLFFGERRHYLNTDVDDWFNSSDHLIAGAGNYPAPGQPWPNLVPSPTCSTASAPCINDDPGFQMSGHDAYNLRTQQNALRTRYPLASGYTMGLAYNGGDADLAAGATCYPSGGINRLTATSRCVRNDFRWINHTLTHPKMNFTDYATSRQEISQNLSVARQLGFPVDGTVLKTGEYSGLGVYHPDVTNDIDPPTDYGLGASNKALLDAAADLGVKFLHGNMSFKSHQPACFNCNIVHPLKPSLRLVPDWPTNVAYFSTTPAEETYFYNWFYGPSGKFAFWPTNQTYDQVLNHEADQALTHLATGSIYTHTFHISNTYDYGGGRTLLTDWVDRLLAKYSSYYSVPVLTPTWPALAAYTSNRNAHFAELAAGVDAVYDRTANTVTVRSPATGSLTVSGARTTGFSAYGSEVSARISLTANTPVTFTPSLLT